MVIASASVNLPLHHKVEKFSSGTGSPRWSRKRAENGCGVVEIIKTILTSVYVTALNSSLGNTISVSKLVVIWRFDGFLNGGYLPFGLFKF